MIQIIIDISAIKQSDSALIVFDNLSYIKAYKVVQDALLYDNDCEVIVRKRVHKVWFERMSDRHSSKFVFKKVTIGQLLEEKWGISIPSSVIEDDINELKLFEVTEKPSKGTQFEDFLLGYFYSSVLSNKKLELEDIPELLNCFNRKSWNENSKYKLLKSIYEERLKLWFDKANTDQKKIVAKLINDIQAFRVELIHYKILKHYKKLLKKLVPEYYLFDALKFNTNKLNYDENELTDLLKQLEYEINSWKRPANEKELLAFVKNMSGLLIFEFNQIKNILNVNPSLISVEIIRAIEIRFNGLMNEIREELEQFGSKIPPEFPEEPNMDWNVEQMLSWCTKEYFPYFYWASNNSEDFTHLAELGNKFSVWYYKEYENIIANDKHILYKFLPNNFKFFDSKEGINIVLIIDNFPWFLAKELKDIFEKSKINLSSIQPYLSMLPSITEVSKKCLLTGQDRYNKIEEKTYKGILESKGWIPYFEDKRFKYYPNLGSFKKEKDLSPGAYFINYLEIDELFHKSEEKLGDFHIDYIKDYLKKLIKVVTEVLKENNVLNDAYIHIISDHGATILKSGEEIEVDKDYFKSNGPFEGSYRYIKLETKTLKAIPSYIRDQCFILEEARYGTPSHYIVPRKNNSFFKVNETVWAHGGLLPEEVIIPHMIFKKVDFVVEKPDVILKNNSFRYAVQSIDIEIGNPNEYSMEDIYISILNTNFEAEETTIKLPEIKTKNKVSISFKGKFKQTSINREREMLNIEIGCSINSYNYKFETDYPIVLKSMIETKGDDIFDGY